MLFRSEWIIDPKTKVAVVIWSMEILKALRPHIYWIEQSWEDIVENVVSRNTPAIQSRIKNSWSK